ncbi:hypothetical protein OAP63_17675 [Vibrio sp.]|uniref:Porin n=1 Tax=Vibrio viridaestus TaxID=2487322 RepID=A0A3N9TK81_9VIBR|nr:hypothetical protein [Vibrio viridaestus]MDC0612564.1 hypothetical protein [Vibrio sp.]RQW64223.1 hypothetical protein EES38_06455 [Vibrio viridaestus]
MKIIKMAAVGACLLSASVFAESSNNIDLAGNKVAVGIGADQGLSAVFELNDQYRVTAGNDGLAFDYLFQRGTFSNPDIPVDWYVGAGGWTEWDNDDYGARLPVGINWNYQKINVYGQVSPQFDFGDDDELEIGAAVGVTYSF